MVNKNTAVKWKEATSAFQRNGGLKCHGLDVWHSASFKTVMLSAITSRGERATGHISICLLYTSDAADE